MKSKKQNRLNPRKNLFRKPKPFRRQDQIRQLRRKKKKKKMPLKRFRSQDQILQQRRKKKKKMSLKRFRSSTLCMHRPWWRSLWFPRKKNHRRRKAKRRIENLRKSTSEQRKRKFNRRKMENRWKRKGNRRKRKENRRKRKENRRRKNHQKSTSEQRNVLLSRNRPSIVVLCLKAAPTKSEMFPIHQRRSTPVTSSSGKRFPFAKPRQRRTLSSTRRIRSRSPARFVPSRRSLFSSRLALSLTTFRTKVNRDSCARMDLWWEIVPIWLPKAQPFARSENLMPPTTSKWRFFQLRSMFAFS